MKDVFHWADLAAQKIIREKGDKQKYVLASGITPSGVIHIGNFREIITTYFIQRALENLGKEVRFIFSWDDYDVFRKIPLDMPDQEKLKKYLWKPIVETPDPYNEESSYARYHEKKLEDSLKLVHISPEYIYQSKEYRSSRYAQSIIKALDKTKEIQNTLNQHRKEPLSKDWLPISIFCDKCRSNKVSMKRESSEVVSYHCHECDNKEEINITTSSIVKLLWRVDWPMRWEQEKVDFEPGGKDHSSDGGSYDTAKEIVKEVFDFEAPTYIMYDFVRIKGKGGKISSSKGNVITLSDVLEVYEPEIVRWIFSSYKPNVEFSISFDLDVLKIYEDYDRTQRIYHGLEEVSKSKEKTIKRSFELAQMKEVEKESGLIQFPFRHFSNVIQIYDFDFEKVKEFYKKDLNDKNREQFKIRYKCISNWIKKYAPKDFQFSIREEKNTTISLTETEKELLSETCDFLKKNKESSQEELSSFIFSSIKEKNIEIKEGFKVFYQCLINKEKGPKLAPFMKIVGYDRVISLIDF